MQNKKLWIGLVLGLASCLQVKAQDAKQDSTYKKYFVGSTLFMIDHVDLTHSSKIIQLHLGYRLTAKDVVSVELITWKYAWSLGINPFDKNVYEHPDEKFPGHIREYGLGLVYQRFFWKGLYASVTMMPTYQTFKHENRNMREPGFQLLNTNRVGYHFKLLKDRFFMEPSIGFAYRAFHTSMPDGFKVKDDKWSKRVPFVPGLHIGYPF